MRLNQRPARARARRFFWAVAICLAAAMPGQAQQLGGQTDSMQAPRLTSNLTQQGGAVPQGVQDAGVQVQVIDRGNKPSGLIQRRPIVIETPPLVLHAFEPLVIKTKDLIIAAFEPLVIDTPTITIVAHELLVIDTPDILLVAEEDDKDEEKAQGDGGAGGSGPPVIRGVEFFSSAGRKPTSGGDETPTERTAKRICVGEYALHSAGAVAKGFGNPEMPVGTPVTAKASLSTDSCGAFLTMTSQGQNILLARQHGEENVYVGELRMSDNISRTLRLTCGRGLAMWGVLYAQDDSVKIRRPMWLRPVRTTTTTLASCAK